MANYRKLEPWPLRPVPPGIPGLEPHDCSYRREAEALKARLDKVQQEARERLANLEYENHILKLELAAMNNPEVAHISRVLVAASKTYDEQRRKGAVSEDGWAEVPRWKVAQRAGVDVSTVTRHLKRAHEHGLLERDVISQRLDTPVANASTGEIRRHDTHLLVKVDGEYAEQLERIRTYVAPDHLRSKHGGPRPRCSEHPNAPVIRTTTYQCGECYRVLDTERKIIGAEDDDMP